ncbi:hypothetical protein ABPG72_002825 [Tetrahymena utriculariae]
MAERQLFASFFRTLLDKNAVITVELKNDVKIKGKITYVDGNMNFNLVDIQDQETVQIANFKNCFIRGSSVRYIHLEKEDIDVELIQEACLKEFKEKQQ